MEKHTDRAAVRLRRPERCQGEMQVISLEEMLPPDHVARVVWAYVEQVDCSALLEPIRSRAGQAGNPAIDPRLLLALWLLATIHGAGSAREVARRCQEHTAYRWLCGGVSVNHHTLSDFRTGQHDFLDDLLSRSVAVLLHQDLIVLDRVAQDGMRVRASAGAASFRRPASLAKCLDQARAQVEALKASCDGGAEGRRQERLAAEHQGRIVRALAEAEQLAQQRQERQVKKGGKVREARASTTDPEARVMKMPDGGYRPAYNVQLATTTQGGIIAGVDVTNQGSDGGLLLPMVEQLQRRYGAKPKEVLADGGFVALDDIEALHRDHQIDVYAPVKDEDKKRAAGQDPFAARPKDSPGVAQWRGRMGTEAAKQIYRERAATAEWANAGMRNRGLYQFCVRGLAKVLSVALWYALAHNLLRAAVLVAPS